MKKSNSVFLKNMPIYRAIPHRKLKMMQIQHTELQYGGVFVYHQEGNKLAEISYKWRDAQTIIADHTWVDDSLRGQGVARVMLDALVDFAREKQLKIIPTCSYVEVMFRREKSLADVIA